MRYPAVWSLDATPADRADVPLDEAGWPAADGPDRAAEPGSAAADPERRVEDWVTRCLDGAGGDAGWPVGGSARGRRRPGDRSDPARWGRFRSDRRGGVTTVLLTDSSLVRDDWIDEVAAGLAVLIASGSSRIVLDFAGVERVSSRFATAIGPAARRCGGTPGGGLRACNLRPEIAAIASIASIGADRVESFADESSAVDSPWPGPEPVATLPVAIIRELTAAQAPRPDPGPPSPALDGSAGAAGDGTRPDLAPITLIERGGTPGSGRVVPVVGDRFLIGREPGCQLRVDSPRVSRRHARVERIDGVARLRDLGSTNGTTVNGRLVRSDSVRIVDGDRIAIGESEFVVSTSRRAEAMESQILAWLADGVEDEAPEYPTLAEIEATAVNDPLAGLDRLDLGVSPGILRCQAIRDVLILTPMAGDLADEAAIEAFREALLAVRSRHPARRVVLNLAWVERMSSHATGVLVAHQIRLMRDGGGLRCGLARPLVASYLDQIRLPMLVDLHPTIEEAVLAAW